MEMEQQDSVAPEMVVQRNHRGPDPACAQKRLVRKDGWTRVRRETFLQILGDTCNVSEAVRAVGMTIAGVYDLRKRDAEFAGQWREALERAYSLLECMLVNRGLIGEERVETLSTGSGDDATVKTTRTIRSYSSAMALRLLMAHREDVQRFRSEKGFDADDSVAERFQSELASARVRIGERAFSRHERRAAEAQQRKAKAGA